MLPLWAARYTGVRSGGMFEDKNGLAIQLKGIYLVGFMASGKTTIGRALAEAIGWRFIDIDSEIEAREGRAIAQIFSERGEWTFRDMETRAIRDSILSMQAGGPAVVALGGGAFIPAINRELIERNGVTVWLDCPLEAICRRLGDDSTRPLAADRSRLEKLFTERRPIYARANYRVDIDSDDLDEIVKRIRTLPIF